MTKCFEIVSIFPELFDSVLGASLLGKAIERGLVTVHRTDPRDFAAGRHRSVDDAPYGGGSGMVMQVEPLVAAIESIERQRGRAHKILLTPSGARLDQRAVVRLCGEERILLVCGRYEGYDERVAQFVDEELSLGDFVLSGGEVAALAVIDTVSRRLPGVLGNEASPIEESFEDGLLEFPQYTRPADFRGLAVPAVLLSGDHEKIRRWRRREALRRTATRRPDLLSTLRLSDEDRRLLEEEDF